MTSLPYRNVVAGTGFDEPVQMMLGTEHFSSINSVTRPISGLRFTPHGGAEQSLARKRAEGRVAIRAPGVRPSDHRLKHSFRAVLRAGAAGAVITPGN